MRVAAASATMVAEVPYNLTPRHPPSHVVDNLPRHGRWAIDTRIDSRTVLESIPVYIAHSGADYLLPDFGDACRQAPYKLKKNRVGRLCMGTPRSEHTKNR